MSYVLSGALGLNDFFFWILVVEGGDTVIDGTVRVEEGVEWVFLSLHAVERKHHKFNIFIFNPK